MRMMSPRELAVKRFSDAELNNEQYMLIIFFQQHRILSRLQSYFSTAALIYLDYELFRAGTVFLQKQ